MDKFLVFIPYRKLGGLDFGMSREQVWEICGEPVSSCMYGFPIENRYLDDYGSFHALCSSKQVLEAVELFPDTSAEDIFLEYSGQSVHISNEKLLKVKHLLNYMEHHYPQITDYKFCKESNRLIDQYVEKHHDQFEKKVQIFLSSRCLEGNHMEITKENNMVCINGTRIFFSDHVEKVLAFPEYCVIHLMNNHIPINNVEAFDYAGNKVWNISQIIRLAQPEAYVALSKESETAFSVVSYHGVRFVVDTAARQIISKHITK